MGIQTGQAPALAGNNFSAVGGEFGLATLEDGFNNSILGKTELGDEHDTGSGRCGYKLFH